MAVYRVPIDQMEPFIREKAEEGYRLVSASRRGRFAVLRFIHLG